MRTVADRVRQTKATKQSAKDFGRAVQLSRILRGYLSPCLPDYKSKPTMHTMNAALLSWFRQEKPLEEHISFVGLEFNEKSTLTSKFRQQPEVDFSQKGKIVVSFPGLRIPEDIVAPPHTTSVQIKIGVVCFVFSAFNASGFGSDSIEIPYKASLPPMKKEVMLKGKLGDLNVVAMSLRYTTSQYSDVNEITDPKWMPAAIIAGHWSEKE